MTETTVQALLNERAGYVVQGKTDRVAAVDAELAHFGVSADNPPTTAAEDQAEAQAAADAAEEARAALELERSTYVQALREEREGLVRAGKTDRIKAVDEELAKVGATPAEAAGSASAPGTEKATPAKRQPRKATAKKAAAAKATEGDNAAEAPAEETAAADDPEAAAKAATDAG